MLDAFEKRELGVAVDNIIRRNDYDGIDVILKSLENMFSEAVGKDIKLVAIDKGDEK